MTAREFPGDAAGRSRQGLVATYVLYVGGEDVVDCSDAGLRDGPFGSEAKAIAAGHLNATPGQKMQIFRHDPEAKEGFEIVCCHLDWAPA